MSQVLSQFYAVKHPFTLQTEGSELEKLILFIRSESISWTTYGESFSIDVMIHHVAEEALCLLCVLKCKEWRLSRLNCASFDTRVIGSWQRTGIVRNCYSSEIGSILRSFERILENKYRFIKDPYVYTLKLDYPRKIKLIPVFPATQDTERFYAVTLESCAGPLSPIIEKLIPLQSHVAL